MAELTFTGLLHSAQIILLTILAGGGGASDITSSLTGLLQNVQNILLAIGGGTCVVGIMVGGLMRATAFGSERRIAASNVALSCAVIGLLIVLLAGTVASGIESIVK